MRISAKGRYGLASMIYMAGRPLDENVTIVRMSEILGISKIYLEQTFSLLKRAGLVVSLKGAQGGYRLARPSSQMNAREILAAMETSLFESAEPAVQDSAPILDGVMADLVFRPMDEAVAGALERVSLALLAEEAAHRRDGGGYMFFI